VHLMKIRSRVRDYEALFGKLDSFLAKIEKENNSLACYVVDQKVWGLYKKGCFDRLDRSRIILFKADEFNKSLAAVMRLYDALIERAAKKNIVLVSIGGGITQDVSGFLASTIYRGIKWIYVPTTLLAQADSCIGGKTSLNYKDYKNLIGTFYPPHCIIVDTDFIRTQKTLDFYSGIGEIVKLHIIGGGKYINSVTKDLPRIVKRRGNYLFKAVYNSLLIKKGYIEEDEFDQGKRNLLNYGHCFGHALESASNFKIPHGQAIVAGMMLANIVSKARGILSSRVEKKLFDELLLPILFVGVKSDLRKEESIIASMKKDKKRTGQKLPLIIIDDCLKARRVDDLEEDEIRFALGELASIIK